MPGLDSVWLESQYPFLRICPRCFHRWVSLEAWRSATKRVGEEVRAGHEVLLREHINCGGKMYEPNIRVHIPGT